MKNNTFYRLPKELFSDEKYKKMSSDAKLLYAFLSDRLSLSEKNGWVDKDGKTYLYFTHSEAMEVLSIGKDKCVRVFAELADAGLIERKKQGLGKPALVYIKDVLTPSFKNTCTPETRRHDGAKSRSHDCFIKESNNNYNNKNNINNTYITNPYSVEEEKGEMERMFREHINYNALIAHNDRETVDRLVEIMTEVIMANKSADFKINSSKIKRNTVLSRMLKLEYDHICYVLKCLKNVSDVKNIHGYMLSMLYNSYERVKINDE